jgi:hypothetical protein
MVGLLSRDIMIFCSAWNSRPIGPIGTSAQNGLLEPLHKALLGFAQTLVEQRRVVPRGLVVQGFHQLAQRRQGGVAQHVHVFGRFLKRGKLGDRDALQEALPLGDVLGLVHLGQGLADLVGTAFQRQIVARGGAQHPVHALQLFVGGFFDRLVDKLRPGFAGESARNRVAALQRLHRHITHQTRHGHRRIAGRCAGLDAGVHPLARRHATHHFAQVFARLVQQGQVVLYHWVFGGVQVLDRKRHHLLGALNQAFHRHGATVLLQPAAPEAADLVDQMARLHVLLVAQHQIGFERVVGVFHIDG